MTVVPEIVVAFEDWRLAEYDYVVAFTEGLPDAEHREAELFARELAWVAISEASDVYDLQDSKMAASLELHDFYEGISKLGEL
jgi:hypothetical protein